MWAFIIYMEHLLEYKDYKLSVSPEAFLIKPIRGLFNADKTKNKEKFMQQLSVLYFCFDPRSTYNYIVDEEDRLKAIIEQEGLPSDFKISKQLQEAIDIYKKHVITTSYLLLEDSRIAIDRVRQFLRNVDLTATDDRGKPLYSINQITTALKQVPDLASALIEAEKNVSKEIEEQGRARGNQGSKTLLDDGIGFLFS